MRIYFHLFLPVLRITPPGFVNFGILFLDKDVFTHVSTSHIPCSGSKQSVGHTREGGEELGALGHGCLWGKWGCS